ncbi:hypothetical protein [Helicobacter canis]|uniref:Membrane protein n=1 Tax=Helicobacter canis TaxID=29419 RepID=A0A377J3E4_9HELI|nr:hypothetical protein [Helicobacter canis]STO96991.1 membrane protein [Helicobacter canis]
MVQEMKHNTYKQIAKVALLCFVFFIWTMCNRIFLFLPPMIGLLFIIFMDVYQRKNLIATIGILICLVIFEAQNQLPLGILPLVFLIVRYIITEKFNLIFGHNALFVFWYVGVLYLSYFFVMYIFEMFGFGLEFKMHSIFIVYFVCESCLGLVYEKLKKIANEKY